MKKSLFLIACVLGCTPNIEFPVPETVAFEAPELTTSIQSVWERVQQSESGFIRFEETESPLWMSGFVTSSDATGNFYKELYIQDDFQNPKRGLRLLLDQTALHTFAPFGTKVYVYLNGLGAGIHQGVLSLGSYEADGVAVLPVPLINTHLLRSEKIEEILPIPLRISKIHPDQIGLWVVLEGVQFSKSELGKTFAGEAFDEFDGERWLVDCEDFRSISISTSVFSKFKSVLVDSLQGTVSGVLTRDFFNEKDLLQINKLTDLHFTESRCDPFFGASFETHPMGRFEGAGWTNYIEEGTQYWEVYEDENSLGQSLRIGSFRSRDEETVCWLITPKVDLSNLNNPVFSFRTSTAFADKSKLEVFYSENFEGSPSEIKQAEWKPLDVRIASSQDNDVIWIDSGNLPLPSKNAVHFAFRYTGSGKTAEDGTFELDEVRVFEGE